MVLAGQGEQRAVLRAEWQRVDAADPQARLHGRGGEHVELVRLADEAEAARLRVCVGLVLRHGRGGEARQGSEYPISLCQRTDATSRVLTEGHVDAISALCFGSGVTSVSKVKVKAFSG